MSTPRFWTVSLPPGPATGGTFDDGIGTDRQIGDEAVAVGGLAASVDDLDLEPVDDQRIAPVAQRDIMEPAIAVYEALLATLDRLLQHRQIGAGQVFLDQRMRRRLADEDEVPAAIQHR